VHAVSWLTANVTILFCHRRERRGQYTTKSRSAVSKLCCVLRVAAAPNRAPKRWRCSEAACILSPGTPMPPNTLLCRLIDTHFNRYTSTTTSSHHTTAATTTAYSHSHQHSTSSALQPGNPQMTSKGHRTGRGGRRGPRLRGSPGAHVRGPLGSWTAPLWGHLASAPPPAEPAQAHLPGRTTGRCPAQLIVGKKKNKAKKRG
jgi:hypothetical protein